MLLVFPAPMDTLRQGGVEKKGKNYVTFICNFENKVTLLNRKEQGIQCNINCFKV